jgi:hypothetical protein
MMKRIPTVLILAVLPTACLGILDDDCPSFRGDATDPASGVRVVVDGEDHHGSDIGECVFHYTDIQRVVIVSPEGDEYETTKKAGYLYGESQSGEIADLFPDLTALQASSEPVILAVVFRWEQTTIVADLVFHEGSSTGTVLGTRSVPMGKFEFD